MQAAANPQMFHTSSNGQPMQQKQTGYPGARMWYPNAQHVVVPQNQEMMHQPNYVHSEYPANYTRQFGRVDQHQSHLHQQRLHTPRSSTAFVLENNQNKGA